MAACGYTYSTLTSDTNLTAGRETQVFSSQQLTTDDLDVIEQQEAIETIAQKKEKQQTFIKKTYVCGEEQQELGFLQADEIIRMHKEHPEWSVNLNLDQQVIFTEHVDDLSPECKQNGYFGVDENGNLTLFNGAPGKDNVMRTFFQLNIRHLESSLPQDTIKQLHEGIRISDLDEYNSVLSTFSDYAVEETERVLFPRMLDIE